MKQRVGWVDTAKGLLITLVVMGHAPLWPEINHYFHAVRLPAFFFLSGMFFSGRLGFASFLQAKGRRYLLPYLVFALISLAFWLLVRPLSSQAMGTPIVEPFFGTLYGVNAGSWMTHNPAIWFLPCMFLVHLMLYGLTRLAKPVALSVAGLLCAVACTLPIDLIGRLPWSLDSALGLLIFAVVGYCYTWVWIDDAPLPTPVTLALFAVSLLAAGANDFVDVSQARFANGFLYVASGVSGSLVLLDLIKRLPPMPTFQAIGRESQGIFGLHFLVFLVASGVSIKLLHYPVALTYAGLLRENPDANVPLVLAAFTFCGVLGSYGLIKLYRLMGKVIRFDQKEKPKEKPLAGPVGGMRGSVLESKAILPFSL